MRATSAIRRQLAAALVFSLGLGLPLAGCGQQEPAYTGDPVGVDRNARPQVIVKQQDIFVDGHLIRLNTTPAADVKAWNGFDPNVQEDADAYWDKTGIVIHANERRHLAGKPVAVHRVGVWLRRVSDIPASSEIKRPCNDLELKRHEDSVQTRLQSLENVERKYGYPKDEQARQELMEEACIGYEDRPLHAFSGYLEVDGLPLTANMSLTEIQARRKQLGLLPLYNRNVGGPLMYNAPIRPNDLAFNQLWEFEYVPKEGASLDEQKLLKALWIP